MALLCLQSGRAVLLEFEVMQQIGASVTAAKKLTPA